MNEEDYVYEAEMNAMYEKYRYKLWGDLKTNAEKIEFIRCGRCWETGILARSLENEIIALLEK
jgi:hypothetical protein